MEKDYLLVITGYIEHLTQSEVYNIVKRVSHEVGWFELHVTPKTSMIKYLHYGVIEDLQRLCSWKEKKLHLKSPFRSSAEKNYINNIAEQVDIYKVIICYKIQSKHKSNLDL